MQAAIELADRWLNIRRLELNVYTDNEAALKLYQKFGFQIEGTHRHYAFHDGAFVDSYSMARINETH
jgi:putative acetyltransferase